MDGKSKEVTNKIGYFQFLFSRKDIRQSKYVVKDSFADLSLFLINDWEHAGDFFEDKGRFIAVCESV